ncbi:MAG TPA: hypothetical protein VEK15_13265, partial [Vicinamibacteria bacterium]|nr:hypothetical protein [Vicinamibacteria bacterium]
DFVRDVVTDNNNVLNHKFILASPPVVADVFLRSDVGAGTQRGDDAWHTLLAFGRGRGGRFLTLLDVTTAPDDPASLALRWNVGNREGPFVESDPRIDGLGETWSIPAFGNVDTRGVASPDDTEVDQWLVFAGGGYGCVNAAREGEFLFAFQAEDGAIYYRNQTPVATDPAAVIAKNGLVASPTVFIPHREDVADSKDFVTRVYIPDLQGRVLKLDTSDTDPTNWTLNVFAAMGPAHPITAAVTLMNDPFTPNRVFVMAGSGGDRRAPEPAEGFKFRTWIDTDADGQNRTQFLPGDTPSFEQIFNPGERMLVPAVTAGTIGDPAPPVVFFAATSETLDTTLCEFNFSSTLYAVGIESGLPEFDLDVTQPGTGQASLGDVMVQGLFVRDGNLYVTQSGGIGTSGGVSVWGDGSFDDQPAPASFGQYTLMLLVEGFRISPF